ncbi:protein PAT1 homolog 1-like [Anopheles stephensi]|uniref:protein PAT1 homolog 1-like n=1 Tax=Anopheles stephensi TaxID=30069 RepID=UPI001658BB44|nr:protein PAT1 homolog 1-like [Anopheles stephensi]
MSDSFFGFDASLPGEDDDGGGRGRGGGGGGRTGGGRVLGGGSGGRGSDSEEEYDALNDETFGQAREDDWEDLHENLVRLDQREGGDGDSGADSDLDINFSSVGIDNFELDNDTEPEARLQLDPSVWTMPSKPETPRHSVPAVSTQMPSAIGSAPTPIPAPDRFGAPIGRFPALPNPGMRICSLEEIEQNMIKQQQEQMRRGLTPLPRPPPGFPPPSNATPTMQQLPPPMIHRPLPIPIGFPSPALMGGGGGPGGQPGPMGALFPPTNMPPPNAGGQPGTGAPPFPFPVIFQGPPGSLPPNNNINNNNSNGNINNNNNASFSQRLVEEIQQNHPMLPHYRQPPPPGTLAQPPLPMGVPPPGGPGGPGQMPPMPPHGGNFKHPFMGHHHPGFPPNWNGPPPPHHPHHPHGGHHHPGFPGGHHHFPQQQQQQQQGGHGQGGHHHHHQQQQQQQQQHHHQHQGGHRLHNGKQNRNYEYDEYANMMTERAKHWLLGIQLSQLNKDTAYYNDYYFCVIRDRKERERGGERESKAHKDNTFYHPFSQQQNQQHWNGFGRERRNSENSTSTKDGIKEIQPRRYKLVQFENSLGKLQCGSVIAPRKIIDQDVVVDRSVAEGGGPGGSGSAGSGGNSAPGSTDSVHNQRRSRQILLHVENLYRLVLRLEDMSNQLAIEAKQQMKEKRAKERLLAQEKLASGTDEQNNVQTSGSQQVATVPATPVSEVEQDTVENLLDRILPAVNAEGVLRLLSVRKGKLLLTRIQKALGEHSARWTIWCTVLATLVALPKRDREDADDQLSPLFAELELHVKYAQPADLMPLFETLLNTDQLLSLVPRCKFLLLTMLTLIAQMEQLTTSDSSLEQAAALNGQADDGTNDESTAPRLVWTRWMSLLRELARVLQGAAGAAVGAIGSKPQKVLLKLDASCGKVKQLRSHLQRHPELELEHKLRAVVSIIDIGPASSGVDPSTLTKTAEGSGALTPRTTTMTTDASKK